MKKYLLGIDGGGSKTDFLICDAELNEVARRIASRANPNDIGIDALESLLRENIIALLADSKIHNEDIVSAYAGIAGLTSSDYAKRVNSLLASLLPNAKTDALHDGINVLYGAFPFEDGVSVICGTGSSCFVKKGSEIIRIGGYGVFDMSGNGYEIGKAGLAHALQTADGRQKEGILECLLHEKLGGYGKLELLCDIKRDTFQKTIRFKGGRNINYVFLAKFSIGAKLSEAEARELFLLMGHELSERSRCDYLLLCELRNGGTLEDYDSDMVRYGYGTVLSKAD
jgi:N-acetylglucosamine kinase-like BadF-type ATPase